MKFFFLGFLSRTFANHRTAGNAEGNSLTPHYHFDPLHKHLDISWAITAESSPLHIASSRTQTGNLWSLTTKLRALKVNFAHELYQELPENLSLAFDANPSLEVRAFCLDISKVFDRVWHDDLLLKLRRLGLSSKAFEIYFDLIN